MIHTLHGEGMDFDPLDYPEFLVRDPAKHFTGKPIHYQGPDACEVTSHQAARPQRWHRHGIPSRVPAPMKRALLWVLSLSALGLGCQKPKPDPAVVAAAEADGYYLRANAAYLKGDFEAALLSFTEVEKRTPNDPRLPAARGEVFLAQGRLGDALANFQEATQRDPKRQLSWSRLGFVQHQLGENDAAKKSLEKALELSARDWQAREQLSEIEAATDPVKAGDGMKLAARDAPDTEHVRLIERSAELYQKANAADPLFALVAEEEEKGTVSTDLLSLAGGLRVRRGELKQASELYRAATEKARGDSGLWELLGETELKQGHLAQADEAFLEGLKAQDTAVLHVARERLLFQQKKEAEAKKELDRALEVATGEDGENDALVEGLLLAGRKPDALKLLETLSAEPDAARNVSLQVKTAAMAKEMKRQDIRSAACTRLVVLDGGADTKGLCAP